MWRNESYFKYKNPDSGENVHKNGRAHSAHISSGMLCSHPLPIQIGSVTITTYSSTGGATTFLV